MSVKSSGEFRFRTNLFLRYTAADSSIRNDMKIAMQSYCGRTGLGDGAEPDARSVALVASIQSAESLGRIRLGSDVASHSLDIDFRLLSSGFDRRRLREAVRLSWLLARQAPLRKPEFPG